MKLNLGCGPDIKEGYINIDTCPFNDKVVVMDIKNLQFDDSIVDEIHAKDILEHLTYSETKQCIKNWSKICKSGAEIFIQTICWDLFIKAYNDKVWDMETINYMLFAGINWVDGITRPEDFHKSIYSVEYMAKILKENNFLISKIEYEDIDNNLLINSKAHNLNMVIHAKRI